MHTHLYVHLALEDAENFGIKNNEIVSVRVGGDKGGIMHNVHYKVKDTYKLEMHIDDTNAFLINDDIVEIVKMQPFNMAAFPIPFFLFR